MSSKYRIVVLTLSLLVLTSCAKRQGAQNPNTVLLASGADEVGGGGAMTLSPAPPDSHVWPRTYTS